MGRSIRVVRGMRNLTQQTLADKVGVTRAWINKIEQGQDCRLGHFLAIAEALAVPPLALITPFKEEDHRDRVRFLAKHL